jgi:exopolysaccharide biosynthesis polyprenyl glycosylphosphotransferase
MTIGKAAKSAPARKWAARHARLLVASDVAVLLLAFAFRRFAAPDKLGYLIILGEHATYRVNYTLVSAILVASWLLLLWLFGTRDSKIFESGTTEYARVIQASATLFVAVTLTSFFFAITLSRSYLLIVFPLGTLLILVARRFARRYLMLQRSKGLSVTPTLVIGEVESVNSVLRELHKRPDAGLNVVAVVLYGAPGSPLADPAKVAFPVELVTNCSSVAQIIELVNSIDVGYIVLAEAQNLTAADIRELNWQLDPVGHELIFVPKLLEVRGPRLHARPVLNLQLIHMDLPTYLGAGGVVKRVGDFVMSLFGLIVLSPLMIGTALAIWLEDRGPIFFIQERVGINGTPFRIFKFRSMRTDAERILEELSKSSRTVGNEVLFKMKNDPRVTRVGRFIRRHSIDELPQLFNVLIGNMSLVGPRPPLPSEVSAYESHVHRRLLVKPGITGLWQVSGRSELSWEESVKLDLDYVENWSIITDMQILLRTVRVVLFGVGAY